MTAPESEGLKLGGFFLGIGMSMFCWTGIGRLAGLVTDVSQGVALGVGFAMLGAFLLVINPGN